MRRKVIKQGNSTLTLTLPREWTAKHRIAPGDELELRERDGALEVSAEKKPSLKRVTIDITDLSTILLWRFVSSAYRDGNQEIEIRWQEKRKRIGNLYTAFSYDTMPHVPDDELSPLEALQALVNRFIGVEIIDQHEGYCLIREFGRPDDKEFDNSLRRIFLLIKGMADEIRKAVNGDKGPLKAIHLVDTNIDRFEDYCLRTLNLHGYRREEKKGALFSLIFLLEIIGDEYKRLGIRVFQSKREHPFFASYLQKVNEQFDAVYDLFYAFTPTRTVEIYARDKELVTAAQKAYPGLPPQQLEMLLHLQRVRSLCTSLTELIIDLHV